MTIIVTVPKERVIAGDFQMGCGWAAWYQGSCTSGQESKTQGKARMWRRGGGSGDIVDVYPGAVTTG